MPHTCIGAVSFHYHEFLDYVTSENAFRVVEVTAAGGTVYRIAWKPLKKFLLAAFFVLGICLLISTVTTDQAAIFAHRMKPCYLAVTLPVQSPEPASKSMNRHAEACLDLWAFA